MIVPTDFRRLVWRPADPVDLPTHFKPLYGKPRAGQQVYHTSAGIKEYRTFFKHQPNLANRRSPCEQPRKSGNKLRSREFPCLLQVWQGILNIVEETYSDQVVKPLVKALRQEIGPDELAPLVHARPLGVHHREF